MSVQIPNDCTGGASCLVSSDPSKWCPACIEALKMRQRPMLDNSTEQTTCPRCGLPGSEAMIPAAMEPGDTMPRVRRGLRYECGATEDVQSRMCANIVERVHSERARLRREVAQMGGTDDDLIRLGDVLALLDDTQGGDHD